MTTPMTSSRRAGILLALVTAAISGVAVFLNADAVRAFGDATAYTTAKNLVAALVLLALVGAGSRTGARLTRPRTRGQWAGLAAIGVFGGSVPFVLFFEGLARADSAQAAFLHKTLLLWVAVLAMVFLGERLSGVHLVAIALLVVGQIGLVGGVGGFGSAEMMILGATVLWSVEVVVAKRLLAGVSSWTVGVARMGLGSLALMAWVLVRGDLGLLTSMTATQAGWVLLTGALLAGYVATWFAALQRALAVDVTAVLVLAAPLTAGLNAVANGAPLSPVRDWLLVVLAGGALVVWAAWRSQPEPVAVR
ncbi:DMT family transporter [Nocardioides sp.]|uniref:DMT family transporter n=1 Tax=Nocardioides sp. TaxID=35761 RepID=UPI002732CCF0|nr:DMT family transporter [Nocardioides sp.]MDP3893349.1 DMT family transporter [Nocardioides sp.]